MYSKDIDLLINLLSNLQGIGPRSARRIALQLIAKKNTLMIPLGKMMQDVSKLIEKCKHCGNYDSTNPCSICNNEKRDKGVICVVEEQNINEIILATSLTTSGQTTAHYIVSKFKGIKIKVTRLARGLPAGGELDYLDEATLSQALNERIDVDKIIGEKR